MPLGTIDRTPPPFFRQGYSALTKLVFCSALALFLMVADTRLPVVATLRVALATALAEVLAAVVDGLNLDRARALVAQRERAYFRSFGDFFRHLPPGLIVPTENISVSSDYFIATMRVTLGGAQARGMALLARDNSGGWPSVVWRKNP